MTNANSDKITVGSLTGTNSILINAIYLTTGTGANGAEAQTMYGSENFAMLMAGIASKTGYNWELANGKFIIQPSAIVSYSFVNIFDYRNAAGVNVSSDPLHAIQIEPGIKFIGQLEKHVIK